MSQIILKEIREFLRDKTNSFFFVFFPILMVFLLGNLLKFMDSSEFSIGEIKLHYMIDNVNPYQELAIEGFINSVEDNENIIFEKTTDLEQSKLLAGKDEISAVVHFSKEPLQIDIFEGTDNIKNRTVTAIMNGFIQSNKSIASIMKTAPEALFQLGSSKSEFIRQKDLGVKRSMIDYYAVTMAAMLCFFSTLLGAGSFLGERQSKTLNRVIITPKSRVSFFLQKILGMLPQVFIQIAIIMLVSVIAFKANYAATLQNNLYLFLMFVVVTMTMISVGTVFGLLIKRNPTVTIMPVLWLMMFFGGTYSKEINIKGLTNLMPIYQIQQAAFDLTIFGRYTKVNTVILICVLVTVVSLILGAWIFSKKEEER